MSKYDFFTTLSESKAQTLLHEYYQFKKMEKERDHIKKSTKILQEAMKSLFSRAESLPSFDNTILALQKELSSNYSLSAE